MNASESFEGFLGFLSGGSYDVTFSLRKGFCLVRHKILSSLLKNFVAGAVFSVSYFLNVVEEFRSCLSKPEGSVCHFGLSIGRAVMTSHSRCAKDSASCDTKFCLLREYRVSGVRGRVEEFRIFFANIEHRVLTDVLKNFVAAAFFSVSYF